MNAMAGKDETLKHANRNDMTNISRQETQLRARKSVKVTTGHKAALTCRLEVCRAISCNTMCNTLADMYQSN